MSVQTYDKNQYLFTLTVGSTDLTLMSGLAQFELNWRRGIKYVKNLDDNAPYITYTKSQGDFTLQGTAISAEVSTVMESTNDIFQGINPNPTTPTTVTVTCKDIKTGASNTVALSGYPTGKGFTYRQISERFWVLDGIQKYQFID